MLFAKLSHVLFLLKARWLPFLIAKTSQETRLIFRVFVCEIIACFVFVEGALVALTNRENFPGNAFDVQHVFAKLSHVFVFAQEARWLLLLIAKLLTPAWEGVC